MSEAATCRWELLRTQWADGLWVQWVWKTQCNRYWCFLGHSPESAGMRVCRYCGKPLVAVPYVDRKEGGDG